jgi:hypothetical protein
MIPRPGEKQGHFIVRNEGEEKYHLSPGIGALFDQPEIGFP